MVGQPRPVRRASSRTRMAPLPYSRARTGSAGSSTIETLPSRYSPTSGASRNRPATGPTRRSMDNGLPGAGPGGADRCGSGGRPGTARVAGWASMGAPSGSGLRITPRLATEARAADRPSGGGDPTAVADLGSGPRPRSRRHRIRYRASAPWLRRGEAPNARLPAFGADYLVTTTGMERWPVTIWVAVRTFLVTAGLLAVPGAGSMVMVAISWLLRG